VERIKPPPPGFYPDVPFDEYVAWDAINWGSLKNARRSLACFKYHWEHGDDTDTLDRQKGRIFHCALLEPEKLRTRYVATPATYPVLVKGGDWKGSVKADPEDPSLYVVGKGLGKARQTWNVRVIEEDGQTFAAGVDNAAPLPDGLVAVENRPWNGNATFCRHWSEAIAAKGAEVVPAGELAAGEAMARSLRTIPAAAAFLDQAQVEVSMVWVDPHTGILCKGRADAMLNGQLADAKKSARSVDWESFANIVKRWGYAGQAAMYVDGRRAIYRVAGTPEPDVCMFRFLAVEDEPPYCPAVYDLYDHSEAYSAEWLEYGRMLWHGALQDVANARRDNHWPGHNHPSPGTLPEPEELAVPEYMNLQTGTMR